MTDEDRPDPGDEDQADPGDASSEERSGPPSEDRVRLELVLLAELIQDLARKDSLLEAVPFLFRRLGDLRQVLFDYEVRGTERLLPIEDPKEREARRLIREMEERKREMMKDWEKPWEPDEDEE